MRDKWYKLKQERLRVVVRGNLFLMRTAKKWNELSIEIVQSLSLEIFNTQLEKALGNLI